MTSAPRSTTAPNGARRARAARRSVFQRRSATPEPGVDQAVEQIDQEVAGDEAERDQEHHVLRNALIPVVTVLGLQLGTLIGGAVITEYVFALPGVGRLVVDAVFARDYPLVQGVVLLIALGFIASNLLVDLLYGLIDPRLRRG